MLYFNYFNFILLFSHRHHSLPPQMLKREVIVLNHCYLTHLHTFNMRREWCLIVLIAPLELVKFNVVERKSSSLVVLLSCSDSPKPVEVTLSGWKFSDAWQVRPWVAANILLPFNRLNRLIYLSFDCEKFVFYLVCGAQASLRRWRGKLCCTTCLNEPQVLVNFYSVLKHFNMSLCLKSMRC